MINKNAHAIIGANYGDEGKGLATDYFCSKTTTPTVVRFNGGAQARHTVQTPGYQRHVFSHFGSGALVGAKTYLGPRFICNPVVFAEELDELAGLYANTAVTASPDCVVTTPWDMLLNQIVETSRGIKRHGSCGTGINETVVRNAETTFGFTNKRLHIEQASLVGLLKSIQHEYVPYRLKQLGFELDDITGQERDRFFSESIFDRYMYDLRKFRAMVMLAPPASLINENIIFEGAQGLGLDERRGAFPYVTRSSTGLQNVVELCPELGVDELKAVYVTRPYVTRHGEGPLSHELRTKPWAAIEDLTNIPNKWQGMLRFATMNETELADRITLDLADARYKVLEQHQNLIIRPSVILTCVDQIPGSLDKGAMYFVQDEAVKIEKVPEFLRVLRKHIGCTPDDPTWVSLGPTRNDVLPLISSNLTTGALHGSNSEQRP